MNRSASLLLLALAVPAAAQVSVPDVDPADYETTAPPSVKTERASAVGGAGVGATAADAAPKGKASSGAATEIFAAQGGPGPASSDSSSAAAGAGAAGGVLGQPFEFGQDLHKTPAPVGPLLKFPRYADAPHDAVNTFQLRPVFSAPGTTYAVGFNGTEAPGDWEWVEHLDGTARCVYSAWISETPGGPSAGHRCGPIQTATQGSLYWSGLPANKVIKDTTCFTKPGKKYWLNLKQDWWPADPSAPGAGGAGRSCVEYLKANAPAGALDL